MSNTKTQNPLNKGTGDIKLMEQAFPEIVDALVQSVPKGSSKTPKQATKQTTNKVGLKAPNKPVVNQAKSGTATKQPANKPVVNQAKSSTSTKQPANKPVVNQAKSSTSTKQPANKPVVNQAKNSTSTKQPANAPAARNTQVKPTTQSPPKRAPRRPQPKSRPQNQEQGGNTPRARNPRQPQGQASQRGKQGQGSLRIIPLGGLGEIGKNLTYYEYGGEALLVDCGIAFPDESMPGIDIVIPDFTYVIENQKKIKGLCITHGHEDHIGSIPYLLKHFNLPIYGTKLTLGLVEGKLKEHGLLRGAKLNIVKAGDTIRLGNHLSVEYIHVNHSIPDACALAIHTSAGVVVQTGDFKIDFTPIAGEMIDLARFGELGKQGVLALLSDSTNAEVPGFAESERVVGEGLNLLFAASPEKRIIIATFASNVHRVQQLMDSAIKFNRKVAVSGRSMENVTAKALELGYLKAPKDLLIEIDQAERMPPGKVAIITTGSQGEPMSALTRMARGDHRKLKVTTDDVIILSANPIPGNEKAVTKVVNDLLMLGAEVAYDRAYKLHVSGHANQTELKMMLALTKPKFFVPVHGEYKHMQRHSELGLQMGVPASNIHLGENGQVIEFNQKGMQSTTTVTAGRVFVDGLGVGDVGSIVLRDRKHLAEDGLIVVLATMDKKTGKILAGPDIVSRGFVYVRESEDIIDKARNIARKSIEGCVKKGTREWGTLKSSVRDAVGDYVWQSTKRRPMILPVIQEVS